MVENEVRTSVDTISSTIETKRSHMMPRLTASKTCPVEGVRMTSSSKLRDEVVVGVDCRGLTHADDARALALLDQRRPVHPRAGGKRIAVIDRPLGHALAVRIPGKAGAFPHLRRARWLGQFVAGAEIGGRAGRLHLPVDDLDRLPEPQRIGQLVSAMEELANVGK